jgi:GNAT superfamily N-acetyltransferase
MLVRAYTPADRDACLAVFDGNVPHYFAAHERAEFAAFLDALPGPYLVIEDGADGVIACGGWAANPSTRDADLCWGMVRHDRHGTGVGRRLLDERLARMHDDPTSRAVESVAIKTSQHTRGFYERRGFRAERVIADGFAPGIDRCDMRLELPTGRRPTGV